MATTYFIERNGGAFHVRKLPGAELRAVCETQAEAEAVVAELKARLKTADQASANQALNMARSAYAVLVYFDNSDPDIYGPFASNREAREALEKLRPRYGGDHHVESLTVHKLREVR